MEKLKEENGEGAGEEGATIQQPSSIPVGGKVRDIKKMVSYSRNWQSFHLQSE